MDVDAAAGRITFVRTGNPLASDKYTVILRSAANGFRDGQGALLDGNGDGTAGDNYRGAFTVGAFSGRTLSLPDFARGPGQMVEVPATASGIPIILSDGKGITSASFDLNYDSALLTIASVKRGSGLPAGATLNVTQTSGRIRVDISGKLPAGPVQLVRLMAKVPDKAPYTEKQVLDLANLRLNAGTVAVRGDDALAVVGYFGDTTGNAEISTLDATRLLRVVDGRDSGFGQYRNVDPVIVGDITGDGRLTSLDGTRIQQEATWIITGNRPSTGRRFPPFPAASLPSSGAAPIRL